MRRWILFMGRQVATLKKLSGSDTSRNTFATVHRRLLGTGSFKRSRSTEHPRPARADAFEEEMLQRIGEQPSTNTLAIANQMKTAHQIVWRLFHEHLLHPYLLPTKSAGTRFARLPATSRISSMVFAIRPDIKYTPVIGEYSRSYRYTS